MWEKESINKHKLAAKILCEIKDLTLEFIKNKSEVNEKQVSDFILEKFEERGLKRDKDPPIVAFNLNTDRPHYDPSKNPLVLKEDTLILIDLWANLRGSKAPFADITWMAYKGQNIKEEIKKVFRVVVGARNKVVEFLNLELKKGNMPTGKEVDFAARDFINKAGYEGKFLHTLGHSLGKSSVHGIYSGLSRKNNKPLVKNLPYTIEPGVYLKDKFGIRSEIDFYISDENEVIITTDVQEEIDLL